MNNARDTFASIILAVGLTALFMDAAHWQFSGQALAGIILVLIAVAVWRGVGTRAWREKRAARRAEKTARAAAINDYCCMVDHDLDMQADLDRIEAYANKEHQ